MQVLYKNTFPIPAPGKKLVRLVGLLFYSTYNPTNLTKFFIWSRMQVFIILDYPTLECKILYKNTFPFTATEKKLVRLVGL